MFKGLTARRLYKSFGVKALSYIQHALLDILRKTIVVISQDIPFSNRDFKGRLFEQEARFCPLVCDFRSHPFLASVVGA
jgi:hypothetical protein